MNNEENIVEFEVQSAAEHTEGAEGYSNTDSSVSDSYDSSSNSGVYSDTTNHNNSGDYDDLGYSSGSSETIVSDDSSDYDESESTPESSEPTKPAGTPLNPLRGVLGDKTLEDVIEREAKEEQDTSSPFSLSRTLGGVIISRFVKRQMGVVLLISMFVLIYISLRYMCQKKLVEIDRTETKIVNARYKATVCTSKLTEASRESNVLKRLAECGDSTLSIADEPPYLIKIEEQE